MQLLQEHFVSSFTEAVVPSFVVQNGTQTLPSFFHPQSSKLGYSGFVIKLCPQILDDELQSIDSRIIAGETAEECMPVQAIEEHHLKLLSRYVILTYNITSDLDDIDQERKALFVRGRAMDKLNFLQYNRDGEPETVKPKNRFLASVKN